MDICLNQRASSVHERVTYRACFTVSSNTLNSLSLRACREQNIDSWKPAWLLFLMKHVKGEGEADGAAAPGCSCVSPLWQLTVPLAAPPGGLEAELPQLRSKLHPFALQASHVGGQDAVQAKVLQALPVGWRGGRDGLSRVHSRDTPVTFTSTIPTWRATSGREV